MYGYNYLLNMILWIVLVKEYNIDVKIVDIFDLENVINSKIKVVVFL